MVPPLRFIPLARKWASTAALERKPVQAILLASTMKIWMRRLSHLGESITSNMTTVRCRQIGRTSILPVSQTHLTQARMSMVAVQAR